MNAHQLSELKTMACHQKIAERLKSDPEPVLQKARSNLHRWQATSFHGELPSVLAEWHQILQSKTANEIANYLVEESEEGFRLRSSSPFAGVLGQTERRAIRKKIDNQYHETRAS